MAGTLNIWDDRMPMHVQHDSATGGYKIMTEVGFEGGDIWGSSEEGLEISIGEDEIEWLEHRMLYWLHMVREKKAELEKHGAL